MHYRFERDSRHRPLQVGANSISPTLLPFFDASTPAAEPTKTPLRIYALAAMSASSCSRCSAVRPQKERAQLRCTHRLGWLQLRTSRKRACQLTGTSLALHRLTAWRRCQANSSSWALSRAVKRRSIASSLCLPCCDVTEVAAHVARAAGLRMQGKEWRHDEVRSFLPMARRRSAARGQRNAAHWHPHPARWRNRAAAWPACCGCKTDRCCRVRFPATRRKELAVRCSLLLLIYRNLSNHVAMIRSSNFNTLPKPHELFAPRARLP